ncbi:hypothetical protein TWF694_008738 [Orbilia ellipsospora]|uniref:ribonuclease Z n=1 Tax=Orbilia ellipsospora TaxID=2528407 RepID=A0AAV9XCU0_9PEZI
MKAYLEIVTAPTRDNSSTLMLLHFDERRYLFGHIAEGTQRLFNENTVKIIRISDIFITGRTEWANNGGLTGLLLTMGDIKTHRHLVMQENPKDKKWLVLNPNGSSANHFPPPAEPKVLTIHGGKNMLSTVATTRNFVFRENSGVVFHEYDFTKEDNVFKDDFVKVTPLRVFPKSDDSDGGAAMREMEDMDLGSRETLENVVRGMWNSKPGGLQVGKDDEDYVISLLTRLKEDEERARNEKKEGRAADRVTDTEGESPPKRQKLDSEETTGDSWEDIMGETLAEPPKPKPLPEFPPDRPLRRPWPATITKALPGTFPAGSAISYMIGITQVRGKFRVDKAKELGVKPGPDFRILTAGGSITLQDGTVVHGHQCMDPPRNVPGVAFLDIPDESFVVPTIENVNRWKEERRSNGQHDAIGYWVWVLGPSIEKNEVLRGFIESCDGQHMLNSKSFPFEDVSFKGSSAQAARLNLLDDKVFPLACPDYNYDAQPPTKIPTKDDKIILAQDSLILDIHPNTDIRADKLSPSFNHHEIQNDAKTGFGNGKYWRAIQRAQKRIQVENSSRTVSPSESDEVEFLALGTGSAMPSKYRNVSATAVSIPGFGNLLLDCGESTYNQLLRAHGAKGRESFLKNLKILYISHLHADHHLGTLSVLKAWYLESIKTEEEAPPRLYLIAPPRYLNFLEEYTQIEDFGLRYIKFISCEAFLLERQRPQDALIPEVTQRIDDMMDALPLEKIETSRAVHCRGSFTVAFTFKNPAPEGFKVAYSGDTRPTTGFVEIGKNCTVLLHEATFDDDLSQEAIAKRHCTTSEAIKAGRDMQAQNLLLTHFSQRYPKLPTIQHIPADGNNNPLCDPFLESSEDEESSHVAQSHEIKIERGRSGSPVVSKPADEDIMNIGFAFDMMRIKVKDFWKLERYIPALGKLFKEEAKLELDSTEESSEAVPPPSKKTQKQKSEKQKGRSQSQGNAKDKGKDKKRRENRPSDSSAT